MKFLKNIIPSLFATRSLAEFPYEGVVTVGTQDSCRAVIKEQGEELQTKWGELVQAQDPEIECVQPSWRTEAFAHGSYYIKPVGCDIAEMNKKTVKAVDKEGKMQFAEITCKNGQVEFLDKKIDSKFQITPIDTNLVPVEEKSPQYQESFTQYMKKEHKLLAFKLSVVGVKDIFYNYDNVFVSKDAQIGENNFQIVDMDDFATPCIDLPPMELGIDITMDDITEVIRFMDEEGLQILEERISLINVGGEYKKITDQIYDKYIGLRQALENINSPKCWQEVQAKYDPALATLGDQINEKDNSHLARIATWSKSNQGVEL